MLLALLQRFGALAASLLATIALSNQLGQEALGQWSYILMIATSISAIVRLGSDQIVANRNATYDNFSLNDAYFSFALATFGGGVGVLYSTLLAPEKSYLDALAISMTIVAIILCKVFGAIYTGLGCLQKSIFCKDAYIVFVRSIVLMFSLVLALSSIQYVILVSSVLVILGLLMHITKFVPAQLKEEFSFSYIIDYLKGGLPNFVSSLYSSVYPFLFAYLLKKDGDLILLAKFFVYVRVYSLVNVASGVINTKFNRRIVRSLHCKEITKLTYDYFKAVALNCFVIFFFLVIVGRFSEIIFGLWGFSFDDDVAWSFYILVGFCVNSITGPSLLVITGLGKTKILYINGVVSFAILVVAALMYERFGVLSLAIGLMLVYVFDNVARVLYSVYLCFRYVR